MGYSVQQAIEGTRRGKKSIVDKADFERNQRNLFEFEM